MSVKVIHQDMSVKVRSMRILSISTFKRNLYIRFITNQNHKKIKSETKVLRVQKINHIQRKKAIHFKKPYTIFWSKRGGKGSCHEHA